MASNDADVDVRPPVSSFQYTQWALRTRLDASSKLVLAVLCDARNWDIGTAKLSLSDLSEQTGYGRQKVNNCLSVLKTTFDPPLVAAKGCNGHSGAMEYGFPLFDKFASYDLSMANNKAALKETLRAVVTKWDEPRAGQKQKALAHPERKHKPKSSEKVVMMEFGKKKAGLGVS